VSVQCSVFQIWITVFTVIYLVDNIFQNILLIVIRIIPNNLLVITLKLLVKILKIIYSWKGMVLIWKTKVCISTDTPQVGHKKSQGLINIVFE